MDTGARRGGRRGHRLQQDRPGALWRLRRGVSDPLLRDRRRPLAGLAPQGEGRGRGEGPTKRDSLPKVRARAERIGGSEDSRGRGGARLAPQGAKREGREEEEEQKE